WSYREGIETSSFNIPLQFALASCDRPTRLGVVGIKQKYDFAARACLRSNSGNQRVATHCGAGACMAAEQAAHALSDTGRWRWMARWRLDLEATCECLCALDRGRCGSA